MEPTDKKSVATLIEALQVDGYRLKKSQLSSLCGHRFEAGLAPVLSSTIHRFQSCCAGPTMSANFERGDCQCVHQKRPRRSASPYISKQVDLDTMRCYL